MSHSDVAHPAPSPLEDQLAGPMAEVIEAMADLPDEALNAAATLAMATYNPRISRPEVAAAAEQVKSTSAACAEAMASTTRCIRRVRYRVILRNRRNALRAHVTRRPGPRRRGAGRPAARRRCTRGSARSGDSGPSSDEPEPAPAGHTSEAAA